MIDFSQTQNLIETMVSDRIVPGVNYALIEEQQIFTSTIGFAGIYPQKSQLSPFAIYDLASLTKVLATTNLFLQLYDQGKLNFSEPLQKYLPNFSDSRIRLFHLLTHTSGIRGWIPHRDELTGSELLAALEKLPVTAEFERKMRYADTNFILLGQVIKKILGLPVQAAAEKYLFQKMPLTATTFTPEKDQCVPTAIVNGHLLRGIPHDPKARQLGAECGSAGLFSSLNDLVKFAQGYLGLRTDILPISQKTISLLFDIKTRGGVHPRSWGWDLRFDPLWHYPLILHTGFTGTLILLDRVRKTGLIMLTNRVHPSGHNQVFLAMREYIINTFLQENCKK